MYMCWQLTHFMLHPITVAYTCLWTPQHHSCILWQKRWCKRRISMLRRQSLNLYVLKWDNQEFQLAISGAKDTNKEQLHLTEISTTTTNRLSNLTLAYRMLPSERFVVFALYGHLRTLDDPCDVTTSKHIPTYGYYGWSIAKFNSYIAVTTSDAVAHTVSDDRRLCKWICNHFWSVNSNASSTSQLLFLVLARLPHTEFSCAWHTLWH